jgi:hypothetical protein
MRLLGACVGVVLVIAVTVSIVATLVIPRGRVGAIKHVDRLVDSLYHLAVRPIKTFERRDSVLAGQPVVVLAFLLVGWLAGYLLGYGLLLWPHDHGLGRALRESGSSLFTLGFAASSGASPTAVDFLAAASGLIVVALQIAYLPTLYSAYNRRETEVTLLSPRAGRPAWGPEILARAQISGSVAELRLLYESWERWSADVAESHSSYPSLLRFRSPEAHSSWVIAQLAVLDAASLHLAACPEGAPFNARLCIQMGFSSLRKLQRTLRFPVNEDPRPDDPIELTYEEFLQGWDRITELGFPVERSPEDAWRHFRGWRVNYEAASYRLAYAMDVVPARWSGPRRDSSLTITPQRFRNRTPDDVEGTGPSRYRATRPQPSD